MKLNKLCKLEQEINDLIDILKTTDDANEKVKIHFTLITLLEVFSASSYTYSSQYYKYQRPSYDVSEYLRKTTLQQISQIHDSECQSIIFEIMKNCKPSVEIFKSYKTTCSKTFTIDEAKCMISDFFYQYDKKLIPIINKALCGENLFLTLNSSIGFINHQNVFFSYNYITKSPFIFVCDNKLTIDTISTIVHEIGHMVNAYLNYQLAQTNFNNFAEVPSCTFEQLFLIWLLKNSIVIEDAEKEINYKIECFMSWIKELIILNTPINSLQKLVCPGSNNHNNETYKYSFGHLLSFYYSDLYQQDEEKTKYNLYQFIKNIGLKDYMYMLSHFGIDKDELVSCEAFKNEMERNQKVLQHLNNK